MLHCIENLSPYQFAKDRFEATEVPMRFGKFPELSSEEVVETFQAINVGQVPQVVAKKVAAA